MTYDELRESGDIKELARVFNTHDKADELLEEIDFPEMEIMPIGTAQSMTAYWRSVCRELHNGLMEDGLKKLVTAASRLRPGNKKLREMLERMKTPLAPPPPPHLDSAHLGEIADCFFRSSTIT
jgi:Effector-associated domain 1